MRSLTAVVVVVLAMSQVIESPPPSSSTTEDYDAAVQALEVFKNVYDFSTEEALVRPKEITRLEFLWDHTTWVMGARGRDANGKWYLDAECNAVMVRPTVAMLPCCCIWSWYNSYLVPNATFKPAPDRTEFDITTPELYVFHTLHPPEGDRNSYLRDEVTHFYTVVNDPLRSDECDLAIDPDAGTGHPINQAKRELQIDGIGLVELETPVFFAGVVPVQIPLNYVSSDFAFLTKDWPVHLMFYGAQFVNPNQVYIPGFAKKDWAKKQEKWRSWSNFAHLNNELVLLFIAPRVKPEGCRAKFNWDKTYERWLECWEPLYLVGQLCNVLPGSSIRTTDGQFYGIIVNSGPCPIPAHTMYFEVRRFNEEHDDIRRLLKVYEERERLRKKIISQLNKPLRLYNLSIGSINYDEDIDPAFRELIRLITKSPGLPAMRRRSNAAHETPLLPLIVLSLSTYLFRCST